MASTNAQRKPATGGARYCELCNSDDEVADYPNGYGGVVALCRGCRLAEDAAS